MHDNNFECKLTPISEELSVMLDMKKILSQQLVHNMYASQDENYGSTSVKDVEIKHDVKNNLTPDMQRILRFYKPLLPTLGYCQN